MREAKIEAYLVQQVAKRRGEAQKFVSPELNGVPDRLVLWTLGDIDFVELKAEGEGADDHQVRDHKRRRARGFRVFVLNCYAAVDWYIEKGRLLSFAEYMGMVDMGHPWCV